MCTERELAQLDRFLLINAKNFESGTAIVATEVQNIVIVNCVGYPDHCACGVVVRKKRTVVGAM